jgi:hypothetical protein
MTGDVGMFWVDQGQRITAAVPVADRVDDGQWVNGPDDHDPSLSRLALIAPQARQRAPLIAHHQ